MFNNWFAIIIYFLVAMILAIIAVPNWLNWLRPEFVTLLVIYAVLAFPEKYNIIFASCVGLLMDLLMNSPLGANMLIFTLIAYVIGKFHMRIRLFPVWRQSLLIFICVLFHLSVLFWIYSILGQCPGTALYWFSSLTSAVFWPVLVYVFDRRL